MRYRQNYRQKREQEQAVRDAAGLISERFAGISGIEFQLTYYRRASEAVLMERTLRFWPESHAHFRVRCEQEGCTGGGYDLEPVVAGLNRSRRTSAKGTLYCHGSDGTIGHGSIAYEVTIQYRQRRA